MWHLHRQKGTEWLKGKIVMKRRFNPRTKRRQVSVKKRREPGAAQLLIFRQLENTASCQRLCVCVCVCVQKKLLTWPNIFNLLLHYCVWWWLIFLPSDASVFAPLSPHPQTHVKQQVFYWARYREWDPFLNPYVLPCFSLGDLNTLGYISKVFSLSLPKLLFIWLFAFVWEGVSIPPIW